MKPLSGLSKQCFVYIGTAVSDNRQRMADFAKVPHQTSDVSEQRLNLAALWHCDTQPLHAVTHWGVARHRGVHLSLPASLE